MTVPGGGSVGCADGVSLPVFLAAMVSAGVVIGGTDSDFSAAAAFILAFAPFAKDAPEGVLFFPLSVNTFGSILDAASRNAVATPPRRKAGSV